MSPQYDFATLTGTKSQYGSSFSVIIGADGGIRRVSVWPFGVYMSFGRDWTGERVTMMLRTKLGEVFFFKDFPPTLPGSAQTTPGEPRGLQRSHAVIGPVQGGHQRAGESSSVEVMPCS